MPLSLSAVVDASNIQCPLEEDIGRIALCVLKCGWKAPPKSFKKEWALKVTLCISPFQKLTFNLYYSTQCFCFAMEILPFSLKKQTFSSQEETWILHGILDTQCKIPAFSQNIIWVWSAVRPPMDNDRMINTLIERKCQLSADSAAVLLVLLAR